MGSRHRKGYRPRIHIPNNGGLAAHSSHCLFLGQFEARDSRCQWQAYRLGPGAQIRRNFPPQDEFEDVHAVALSPSADVIAVCAGDHIHMIRLPDGTRLPEIKTPEALGISVPRWGFSAKDRDDLLAKLLAEVFPGCPKPAPKTAPYRAFTSQTDRETAMEDSSTHQPIAYYPRPLRLIQMTPDRRTFLGFFGSTVRYCSIGAKGFCFAFALTQTDGVGDLLFVILAARPPKLACASFPAGRFFGYATSNNPFERDDASGRT